MSLIVKGRQKLESFKKKKGSNKKGTIEEMRSIAKLYKAEVISKKYTNAHTKLKWKCFEGHIFEMTPHAVKSGKWCPTCARKIINNSKRLSLEDCKEIAHQNGGWCLSKEYINTKESMEWKCGDCNRKWEAPFGQIKGAKNKKGTWCPHCNSLPTITLRDAKHLALERGGQCLSKIYESAQKKLQWKCSEGHEWKASWNTAKNGSWCPTCSEGLSERICRAYFEQLFNRKFPKTRPVWLRNSDGNQMELDGYCEELRIAFEHQGDQHSDSSHYYISSKEQFSKRIEDDKTKKKLCKKQNIKLIEIDQLFVRVKIENFKNYLKSKLIKHKIKVPIGFDKKSIDLSKAYSPKFLKEIKKIAKEKGGKCLSNAYLGAYGKLEFQCCNEEHPTFKLTASKLRSGQWCKLCGKEQWLARVYDNHFEKIKQIVKDKDGKILSKQYLGRKKKLKIKCGNKDHPIFEMTPAGIDAGKWCKHCAYERVSSANRNTMEDMHKLAKQKNGKCLSKTYINNHTKLKWECEYGHRWEANPKEISRGRWCPICGKEKQVSGQRLGIKSMQELAKNKKGQCLSKEYKNNLTKLKWRCDKGHIWEETAGNIKRGQWCPFCSGRRKTIKDLQKLAKSNGGKCLSTKYINAKTKYKWQCKEGHKWNTIVSVIENGSWCPKCGLQKRADARRKSIDDMQKLAKVKQGKCVSRKYVDSKTKLKWQCKFGHTWEAIPSNIRRGRWCPVCARNSKKK